MVADPRRWRNTSHLYLPGINVFATTIHKAGNTAVKSFLIATERASARREKIERYLST